VAGVIRPRWPTRPRSRKSRFRAVACHSAHGLARMGGEVSAPEPADRGAPKLYQPKAGVVTARPLLNQFDRHGWRAGILHILQILLHLPRPGISLDSALGHL